MPHYVIRAKTNGKAIADQIDHPEATVAVSALRIVEAKNAARALAHIVEDTLSVEIAAPADIVELTLAGGAIEKAS